MKIIGLAVALTLAAAPRLCLAAEAPKPAAVPAYVTAALADPARAADQANDARRQIAAVVAFAGVKPGDTVVELVPGSGYWTRVFSAIVGANGHVYTVWPKEMMAKYGTKGFARWAEVSVTPHYANVTDLLEPVAKLAVPAAADVVFTAQNYHDYVDFGVDMLAFDRSVFRTLKPGGAYIVVDHVAPAGSGLADTNTLHRIDPAAVRKQVEAAGFDFDGESTVLHNAADPHTAKVFDPSIRGHTDQFVYRFRKPAR